MSITLDNAPSDRGVISFDNELTWSFNYGGGPGAIYFGVGSVGTDLPISVTYDGQNASAITFDTFSSPNTITYGLWRLLNPSSSGTKDVVVTYTFDQVIFNVSAISFVGGIANNNNHDSGTSGVGNSPFGLTLDLDAGSWMVCVGGSGLTNLTAGTNTTTNSAANPLMGYYGPAGSPGNVTMEVEDSNSSDNIILCVMEVQQSASGATWPGYQSPFGYFRRGLKKLSSGLLVSPDCGELVLA